TEQGFPAPRRYLVSGDGTLSPSPQFPLLIRPQTTRHESGIDVPKAIEVRNEAELAHWLHRYSRAGVEPAIGQSLLRPGIRQYSIGVARRRDGSMRTIVAEKLRSYPDQCAGGTFVVAAQQSRAQGLVDRVMAALDYFGIAEVEVMHDPA